MYIHVASNDRENILERNTEKEDLFIDVSCQVAVYSQYRVMRGDNHDEKDRITTKKRTPQAFRFR